eukprot:scaffold33453_cov53-Phaeocystis_antarctica.AAC.5
MGDGLQLLPATEAQQRHHHQQHRRPLAADRPEDPPSPSSQPHPLTRARSARRRASRGCTCDASPSAASTRWPSSRAARRGAASHRAPSRCGGRALTLTPDPYPFS